MTDKLSIKILVPSQEHAIAVARTLVKAANSVKLNPTLSSIEQISLETQLCALRDSIEIEAVAGQ